MVTFKVLEEWIRSLEVTLVFIGEMDNLIIEVRVVKFDFSWLLASLPLLIKIAIHFSPLIF